MSTHTLVPPPRAARGRRRRTLLAALGAFALAAGTVVTTALNPDTAAGAVPPATGGWSLEWSDDFNGPSGSLPSSANWQIDLGHGYPGGPANWGTGEIQRYTDSPQNISLDGNGNLRITALRSGGGEWTSARIETRRADFKAPAGGTLAIEGRIQMPNVTGQAALGYWPAFWALGSPYRGNYWNWPAIGEFDIMENVNGLNTVWGVLHCGVNPGGPCNETNGLGNSRTCPGASCQSAFHTYRFEWDRSSSPHTLRWFVDGQEYHSLNQNQFDATTWSDMTDHAGYFLLLNLAMGGAFPDGVAGHATPTAATVPGHSMVVDYVAVYTRGGSGSSGGSGSGGSGGDSGGSTGGEDPPSSPTLYLRPSGGLGDAAASGSNVTLASAGGTNHDGTPYQPQVFTAHNVSGSYTGGQTAFDLFVDAGTTVANGQQIRVSYDRTSDGSWDRVETFHYFATDPVPGWEHYTHTAGLKSSSGSHGTMSGGRVRVEVWSAIGNGTSTVGIGNQSRITIPFS
ncbi:glycoside hydrolase family 16 protein [Streptomyces sp. YIM 98790]|uniref:glycoside hydrolase family 16 protein n=1 Tax=Streptomyces sp. YIM 98790 TaxID=2689077 RepID=UPI00140A0102|nr:glycoside hydrolase family 16 protein [Streptomyces sp. YIM 98790]